MLKKKIVTNIVFLPIYSSNSSDLRTNLFPGKNKLNNICIENTWCKLIFSYKKFTMKTYTLIAILKNKGIKCIKMVLGKNSGINQGL